MKKNSVWIYPVLIAFLFLLAPKELWHHCEADHEGIDSVLSHQKVIKKSSSCPVCDFHFDSAINNTQEVYRYPKASYYYFDQFAEHQTDSFVCISTNKDPPA